MKLKRTKRTKVSNFDATCSIWILGISEFLAQNNEYELGAEMNTFLTQNTHKLAGSLTIDKVRRPNQRNEEEWRLT